MRRAVRIDRSVDLLRPRAAASKPSPYLCSTCSYRASFSTSVCRPADKKIALTERLRRKIWGTDQPPGQENPYERITAVDQASRQAPELEVAEHDQQRPTRVSMADLDPSYVPASTWHGLERVGGFGNWWKENWDPENQFEGFLPRDKATDKDTVTDALHRAMVEVFALREAGIPLSEVSKTVSEWDPTRFVQILPSVTGATLQFSRAASLDKVIQSLTPATGETDEIDETAVKENPSESEADVAADRSTVDPLHPHSPVEVDEDETAVKGNPSESEEDVAADRSPVDPLHKVKPQSHKSASVKSVSGSGVNESWNSTWLEVSLEDPEVKFAVLKRTMQLTGIRIPDPVIKSSNTAQALLKHLVAPPKPTKVIEALTQKGDLAELPNVSIYGRRRTPVHRERSVGRWKVIEEELKERGLPVFGKHELNQMSLPAFSRNR